jgi:bifunctional DNase/RNase
MTHDLLRSALRAAGASVDHVEVTRLHEGVFHAALQLDNGRRVDSRASDAIAVALRFGCPVLCARAVVEEAGVPVRPAEEPEGPPDDGPRDAAAEVDVAEFVDFLDHVSAADFGEEGSGPQVPPASPSGGD